MPDAPGGIFGPPSQPQANAPGTNGMAMAGLPQAGVTPTPGLTLQQLLPLIQALIARAQSASNPQMQVQPGVQMPGMGGPPQGMTGNAMPQPSGPYQGPSPVSVLGVRG